MWHVMWLQSHASSFSKRKEKEKIIKFIKIDKRKEKIVSVQVYYNIYSINRIAIYQWLLVKFSCDLHIDILLRDLLFVLLLVFVTSGCYNSRTRPSFRDFASCGLLFFFFTLYSSSTEGNVSKVKKTYSWALGLRGTLARQRKLS